MVVFIDTLILLCGAGLFVTNLIFIGNRRMDPGSGAAWAVFAILTTVMGCLFNFTWVISLIRPWNVLLLVLLAILLIFSAYAISMRVSTLRKRNDELTIRLALLEEQVREPERRSAGKERSEDG